MFRLVGIRHGLLASLTLLGLVVRMTKRTPGVSAERSAPTTWEMS
jgi:hypothetical protein